MSAPDAAPGDSFGSPRQACLAGVRLGLGAPAIVLGASYVGFGSLIRASDMTVAMGLFSTATGWALPGQIALVELYAAGASLAAIVAAVALANVRLLPMTMALMPLLRHRGIALRVYFLAAHFVAVTGWVHAMKQCPTLPTEERLPFFMGVTVTLWAVTFLCTGAGFYLAGAVPGYVSLGLVFLNPIYFMLVLTADLRDRARLRAMLLGVLMGPPMHLLSPGYGLLITGVLAGTLAYLPELWRRRHG